MINDIENDIDSNKVSISPNPPPTKLVEISGDITDVFTPNTSAAVVPAINVLAVTDAAKPVGGRGSKYLTMLERDSGLVFD